MENPIISHKAEDVYSTPTSPDKVELTAKYIAQDFASIVSSDIDVLYSIVNELKTV